MFYQTRAQADKTIQRAGHRHPGLTLSLVAGVLASLVLAMSPADAGIRMPRIRLTGGGPEVTATYTASTPGYRWSRGVTPRYQWYRGAANGNTSSFRAIRNATNRRYTLKQADHGHTIRVAVRAAASPSLHSPNQASASAAASAWTTFATAFENMEKWKRHP